MIGKSLLISLTNFAILIELERGENRKTLSIVKGAVIMQKIEFSDMVNGFHKTGTQRV